MNSIVLQLAIRQSASGFRLRIIEQRSREIRFSGSRWNLRCNDRPQLGAGTFYLRGNHSQYDHEWLKIRSEATHRTVTDIIQLLGEFARYSNYIIERIVFQDQMAIVISERDDPYSEPSSDNNNFIAIDVLRELMNLRITDEKAFTNLEIKCHQCKTECNKDYRDIRFDSSVITICGKCLNKMIKCEFCGNYGESILKHTNSVGNSRNVCKRCQTYTNCESCQFPELSFEVRKCHNISPEGNNFTERLCLKCSGKNGKCGSCGNVYSSKLPKCVCRIPTDFKRMIHPHNADVLDILQGDYDCTLGMEIEVGVECKNRIQYEEIFSHTSNILGSDAIAVYDSSIDYIDKNAGVWNKFRGFEIVTRPLNYSNMIDFISRLTDKRHSNLRSWDVETTGIHIHVARNTKRINKKTGLAEPNLTKIEIGKLLLFINEPKNRYMIKHIARRYNTRYAKLRPKRITDHSDRRAECHYDAINTNKTHTIEFRIFRGSLNKNTILSYLQFVYSAIEFVRITPTKYLSAAQYLKWMSTTHKSMYRDLKERLATLRKKDQLEVGDEL